MKVYIVRYDFYGLIDSVHATEELAKKRQEEMGGGEEGTWVEEYDVNEGPKV